MGTNSPKGTLNECSNGNSKIPMLRSICYEHIYYYKSQIYQKWIYIIFIPDGDRWSKLRYYYYGYMCLILLQL